MSDELAELKARISRLEAEREVQNVFTQYLYYLDVGYPDRLVGLFAADGVLDVVNFPPGSMADLHFEGPEKIATLYKPYGERGQFIRGGHHSANLTTNVAKDLASAELSAYFMTSGGASGSVQGGQYQLTFKPLAGHWKIATMRITSGWGWVAAGEPKGITEAVPVSKVARGGGPVVYEP